MMSRNILIAVPQLAGLDRLIADNLRHHGFNPINIMEDDLSFAYPSLISRIKSKWHKLVYKNDEVRKQIKWQTLQAQIAGKIAAAGGLDYALFIGADRYSIDFLRFIRSHSRNGIVNYQCDGLNRYPAIMERIAEFDRFYVFDGQDLSYSTDLLPATNFYFDHNIARQPENNDKFYFLGGHEPSRTAVINRFAEYAGQHSLNTDISIVWRKTEAAGRTVYPHQNIKLIGKSTHKFQDADRSKPISFNDNLTKVQSAAVLLDFVVSDHQGLSFRCFEALGYRKKLITTNPTVAHYDFYHSNNILMWDGCDFAAIDDFLNKPYCDIDAEIRQKYSFGNWINYILAIQPHQKINLP